MPESSAQLGCTTCVVRQKQWMSIVQKVQCKPNFMVKLCLKSLVSPLQPTLRSLTLHRHRRDLKGPNIFLSGTGDVLVGDFGLATLREPGDEAKHDQSVVGTPHYLSPELVSGKRYSFETDIWWVYSCVFEQVVRWMGEIK